ncbi:hypothetical protein [Pseudomonas brassicacearum]|uniref:hypothetical protein n=1 Tax=Pseudomonas brassicacearum TaxID=930166 RepID=UPI001611D364|nr:hypothetical protein [Pseudomonas brassicacearum]
MKRTTALIFVVLAALLLGGCWPYWHDRDGRGHDRGRYYGDNYQAQEYRPA